MAQYQQQAPNQNDYITLLSGLGDADGERRKQAEEVYNAIPAKDRFSVLGAALCQKEVAVDHRVFAAVLLRRLVVTSWSEIQSSIPPQQLLLSCNELLNVLRNSYNEPKEIRSKMAQVIVFLARNYLDENTQTNSWSDFIQFLFELFRSPQLELREVGFEIFSSHPENVGEANGQTAYIEQIHQCFVENLELKGKPDSFYSGLIAACCGLIIRNSSNKECIKKLSTLAPPMVEIFRQTTSESTREDICQNFIELAEAAPLCLRPSLTNLMQTCVAIMTDSDGLESDLRFSALELVVTIIENAPVMVKKRAPTYIKPIVLRVLSFMSSIEDDPEWYTACSNERDEDEPDAIGASALDRISNALGGKVLLPILMDELTEMLRRPEWQARHAALMAFSNAGEGCHDQLVRVLDQIVNGILNFLADPHPRVRHAACNAIGQMATDFSPEFENKFHGQVVPALCRLLIDSSNIRVQAHSACAMINFYEECPQEILANYLDPITEHIQLALSNYMSEGLPRDEGKLFVVESIIVALSSVADSSAESFLAYYEKFMPCLKFIIKESSGVENLRLLRGKAIECISLIGMAVGKEKFCADASDIMQMLLATQTGDLKLADDDPQLSYMMGAWARICSILGQDFQAYLPYVMEPVLRAAAMKVEIAVVNEQERAEIENSSDWQSITVQDQAVGIRTAGLEDKATACSMLVCYARELKHRFADYVEKTCEVLVPLLKFPFNDDVRSAAMEAMPYLLESAKPKGEQCVLALWNAMFENLISAFDMESDSAILNLLMESLGSCIEVVGVASMTAERYEKLTNKLNERFKAHFDYLAEEMERRKDEDYETESECSDENQDCLSGIASVIHALFEVYKSDYLLFFQPLVEPILRLSVNDQSTPWTNRQTALCIWDDVIEYTGQNSVNYQKFYLPLLTNGILDKNKDIRQAAMYGIGQLAQQCGPTFIDYFQSVIPSMVQMINHPEARTDDLIMVTENGIAAVCRILKHCPQIASYNDLLKCWLDWLPIWEDDAEVPVVMEFLLQLIEQNNPTVMGPNSTNLTRLVAIVAEVFARSAIATTSEVGMKLVSFLRQVHANPAVNSCLNQLSAPQQKAVQEVLTSS